MRYLISAAIMATLATGASAQNPPICFASAAATTMIAERFGEDLVAGGVVPDVSSYMMFGDDTDGSWTIVRVDRDGTACIVASGFH